MVTKRKEAEASASHATSPAKKGKKATSVDEGGWAAVPPALIYKCSHAESKKARIAAFDFDGTLINLKSGAEFPVTADDWAFFNPKVPSVIQKLHNDGYKVVILANQGFIKGALGGKAAAKAKARLDAVVKALGVPVDVHVATQGDLRKPATGLWDSMCSHSDVQPDKAHSFFVGDAAGRPGDADATDKEFAESIGVEFKLPEQCFGEHENAGLCACFDELALLMKAKGERYKARAFDKVSGTLATGASKITSGQQARALPNVGKASADLIDEFLRTGKMQELEDLRAEVKGAPTQKEDEKGEVEMGKGGQEHQSELKKRPEGVQGEANAQKGEQEAAQGPEGNEQAAADDSEGSNKGTAGEDKSQGKN